MVKCTPRVLFFIFFEDFLRASTEKALNGLKSSTVGNLGSKWAFVIMLLGFTHFLEYKAKSDQNFRT